MKKINKIFERLLFVFIALFISGSLQAKQQSFEQLEAFIDQEAADKNLPMVSVIIVDEKGHVWSYGVGKDENKETLRADNNTTYRIGSVSKLFTDIAVMQLVEKGIIDLDKPVKTYLPDFAPKNPFGVDITLRMLMSHTSGLVREPSVGSYFDPTPPSLTETVLSLNSTMLVYAPGTKVQYSNAGISVVGRVIEVVTGQPFAQALKTSTLNLLGMSHSSFAPEKSLIKRLPSSYMWSYHGDRTVAPTFELGISPAGSMYSTVNDLGLFIEALIAKGKGVNGRLLTESTLEEMWTPQDNVATKGSRSFGIGFILSKLDDERSVSHNGAIYGFSTQLKVLPDRKVGVAVVTNLDMAGGVMNRIADYALRDFLAKKDNKAAPKYYHSHPISDKIAKKIIGFYKHKDETIEIQSRFNNLYVERVNGLSLRLREINGRIIIDDITAFNEEIEFANGKLNIFGKEYNPVNIAKPLPMKESWSKLIGEYGYDHNILYVSEKFGKLHVMIEWATDYSMIDLGDDTFKFPANSLYPNEQIKFIKNNKGDVSGVNLNGIMFNRRSHGKINGKVFQITPVRPVSELEAEALRASPPKEKGQFKKADLVDIETFIPTIKLDIRYASTNNFLGVPVYSSAQAFLQRPAAQALSRVNKALAKKGYGLLVHDAYRPWYVTKIFWDATPEESKKFVADPSQASRHNRGAAIDLTLYDLKTGTPIDMVGGYDEMSPRSYLNYPGGTTLQRWHRELLRESMEVEGFTVYEYEWWHFDFDNWQVYPVLNDQFENLN